MPSWDYRQRTAYSAPLSATATGMPHGWVGRASEIGSAFTSTITPSISRKGRLISGVTISRFRQYQTDNFSPFCQPDVFGWISSVQSCSNPAGTQVTVAHQMYALPQVVAPLANYALAAPAAGSWYGLLRCSQDVIVSSPRFGSDLSAPIQLSRFAIANHMGWYSLSPLLLPSTTAPGSHVHCNGALQSPARKHFLAAS